MIYYRTCQEAAQSVMGEPDEGLVGGNSDCTKASKGVIIVAREEMMV